MNDLGEGDHILRVERTDSTKTRAEKLRFAEQSLGIVQFEVQTHSPAGVGSRTRGPEPPLHCAHNDDSLLAGITSRTVVVADTNHGPKAWASSAPE